MSEQFRYNADEELKLLDRGYRIVLVKDGLGDVTALAVPDGVSVDAAIEAWQEHDGYEDELDAFESQRGRVPDDEEKRVLMQRSVFNGPDGLTGGGLSPSAALHCLAEKVTFRRLPKGDGGHFECPPMPGGAT
jgi:hypothetical protein